MTSALPLLLNAFYEFGNKLGPILTWVFILLMVVQLVYVMAKYLGGGNDKNSRADRDVPASRRDAEVRRDAEASRG